jgi:isocitrate lyase
MKMVKMFVEAGVAAIHLDDLLSGEKNFSAGSMAHVIVPIGEQIRRLLAAKLQLDIMGCVSFQHLRLPFCSTLTRSPLFFLFPAPT